MVCSSDPSEDENTDPCTGFPTTHKAKLSITSIVWNRGQHQEQNTLQNPDQDGLPNRGKHWIGLLLTVLSAFVFSLNVLLAKLLSHMNPFNLGVWTFIPMTFIACLLILCRLCQQGNNNHWFSSGEQCQNPRKIIVYILLRSCCGVSALTLFFYAMKFLTAADAIVIDASSPIFVYVLACIFLDEKFGFLPVFCTIMAFSGVALISRPPLLIHEKDYDLNSLVRAAWLNFQSNKNLETFFKSSIN